MPTAATSPPTTRPTSASPPGSATSATCTRASRPGRTSSACPTIASASSRASASSGRPPPTMPPSRPRSTSANSWPGLPRRMPPRPTLRPTREGCRPASPATRELGIPVSRSSRPTRPPTTRATWPGRARVIRKTPTRPSSRWASGCPSSARNTRSSRRARSRRLLRSASWPSTTSDSNGPRAPPSSTGTFVWSSSSPTRTSMATPTSPSRIRPTPASGSGSRPSASTTRSGSRGRSPTSPRSGGRSSTISASSGTLETGGSPAVPTGRRRATTIPIPTSLPKRLRLRLPAPSLPCKHTEWLGSGLLESRRNKSIRCSFLSNNNKCYFFIYLF
mmetsp:Transcript_16059/g.46110  ORF Transcript_16059/g.46110 Transcript_16059/m.46110 type:complete len:333 (+) Transcript_16059:878-1876(+)